MIKSQATKIRIANRKEARRLFNRSTSEGREAYREYLRGLVINARQNTVSYPANRTNQKAKAAAQRNVGTAREVCGIC